ADDCRGHLHDKALRRIEGSPNPPDRMRIPRDRPRDLQGPVGSEGPLRDEELLQVHEAGLRGPDDSPAWQEEVERDRYADDHAAVVADVLCERGVLGVEIAEIDGPFAGGPLPRSVAAVVGLLATVRIDEDSLRGG